VSPSRILAASGAAKARLVENYVCEQAARVLGLDLDVLDPAQPLAQYGLDSLMAVELKNGIETDLAVVIPMVRFLEGPTSHELAEHIGELLGGEAQQPLRADALVDIDALSEAEIDRMLEELLRSNA
jgi:acyl carrier protein